MIILILIISGSLNIIQLVRFARLKRLKNHFENINHKKVIFYEGSRFVKRNLKHIIEAQLHNLKS